MTEHIGQQFGNYRLTRLLDKGGFASVYLAEHIYLHTAAAIKVLTEQLYDQDLEQFRQEAHILARFHHPNIIRMLDFGLEETEQLPFLVMQYAPHGTLRQRHPEGSCVPLNSVQLYVQSITAALQYAHNHHIIHRDVKPENMLIGEQNELLLSDFGVALLSQNTLSSLQQKTQEMSGTVSYMAPEQLRGKARPASDQYALAVVVYEWLCGVRPFQGSFAEVCSQHLAAQPQPLCQKLPTLSSEVEQVVMKALEKDPKQRFDSVQAFATAFEVAAGQKITASTIESAPTTVLSEHVKEQEKAIANRQSESHLLESVPSSLPVQNDLTATKLAPARRQARKPRSLLIGGVALVLLSTLVGSTIFTVFTLPHIAHNSARAATPSKGTAHSPAAPATSTTPAHPPTETTPTQTPAAPTQMISSADFTAPTPNLNNMTLVTNNAVFTTNHSILSSNQQVTVAFPLLPNVKTVTLSVTALVSQNGPNITGFSPINISCNNQVVASNYTMPGNGGTGIGPATATFPISMQQLTQGSNQVQLVVASNAQTVFWLYNLSVTQSL